MKGPASVEEIVKADVNAQATAFLERYLWEFQSTFEEVLDLAEDFKRRSGSSTTLSEDDFCAVAQEHSLSASRNRTGVSASAAGASFWELCLVVYKKTVHDFLSPPADDGGGVSPEDQARLKKAIEEYQKIQAEIAARENKMKELEAMVKGGGVKGLKAKAELQQMRSQDKTEQNRRAIKGAAAQRSAQKVVQRQSLGGSGSSLQADTIKARIAAAIAERMAKLAKQEQERASALAARFDGAFQEQEESEEAADDLVGEDLGEEVAEEDSFFPDEPEPVASVAAAVAVAVKPAVSQPQEAPRKALPTAPVAEETAKPDHVAAAETPVDDEGGEGEVIIVSMTSTEDDERVRIELEARAAQEQKERVEHEAREQERKAREQEQRAALEREEQERQRQAAEEAANREREQRAKAEELRKIAQAEQEARLAVERKEAEERAVAAAAEAAEMERLKAQAAAALEEARHAEAVRIAQLEAEAAAHQEQQEREAAAQSAAETEAAEKRRAEAVAALEEARRQESARIAELEAQAAAAERAAADKAAAAEAERLSGPVKDFSAWNMCSVAELAELENRSLGFCFKPEKWHNAYKAAVANEKDAVAASLLRVVLNGTLQAIQKCSYELDTEEEPVPLSLDLALLNASFAEAVMYPANHQWPKSTASIKGTAHFLQGDCIDVAVWLQTTRGVKPVIVLSVDPSGNGGPFEKGTLSQEEEVWRRTTFSAVSSATQFLPIEGSGCRYVPKVQLLRQGESAGYAFSTAPVVLSFIAACSVPNPKLNMMGKYSDEDTARIKQTVRAMFGCAMAHGHDAIVIPAFGCGYNKNSPAIVAAIFHDVLVTEYPKSFKHVTFAIQNDKNGPANFENFQTAYINRAKQLAKAKADRKVKRETGKK